MTNVLRHFTDLSVLTPEIARALIEYAKNLKHLLKEGKVQNLLRAKHLR